MVTNVQLFQFLAISQIAIDIHFDRPAEVKVYKVKAKFKQSTFTFPYLTGPHYRSQNVMILDKDIDLI